MELLICPGGRHGQWKETTREEAYCRSDDRFSRCRGRGFGGDRSQVCCKAGQEGGCETRPRFDQEGRTECHEDTEERAQTRCKESRGDKENCQKDLSRTVQENRQEVEAVAAVAK